MGVSENYGTPKSSILIGSSIINHPFWGTPILGSPLIYIYINIYIYTHTHPNTTPQLLLSWPPAQKTLVIEEQGGGTESPTLLGYRWDGVVETREDHSCIKKNGRSWF